MFSVGDKFFSMKQNKIFMNLRQNQIENAKYEQTKKNKNINVDGMRKLQKIL